MFFALFDDIILYLHVPARFVFPTKQHIKKFLLTMTYLIWHHIHQGKGRNVLIISATHICGLNMLESCKQCVARGWVGRFIAWFIPWLGRRGGADEAVSGTKTQITVTITGKHHIVGVYFMRFVKQGSWNNCYYHKIVLLAFWRTNNWWEQDSRSTSSVRICQISSGDKFSRPQCTSN